MVLEKKCKSSMLLTFIDKIAYMYKTKINQLFNRQSSIHHAVPNKQIYTLNYIKDLTL